MREIDSKAEAAAKDDKILEEFIHQNEGFIIKCAWESTRKYVTKSDDEWSVALIAFSDAVKSYRLDKGNFFSFAKLLISRRLIDYYRLNSKQKSSEILVDPYIFDTEPQPEDIDLAIRMQLVKKIAVLDNSSIKDEIEAVNKIFLLYGFSFMDLAKCSPHAEKTKSACAKAVLYIMNNEIVLKELISTKKLPIKIIEKNTKVPRKIIERHRKYIIAAIQILSGEYPELAQYMRYIREENI